MELLYVLLTGRVGAHFVVKPYDIQTSQTAPECQIKIGQLFISESQWSMIQKKYVEQGFKRGRFHLI